MDKVIPDPNFLKTVVTPSLNEDEVNEQKAGVKQAPVEAKPKPQLTDEQIEANLLKRDKETARRKQQFEWKSAELTDVINKHERKLGLQPIGRDRAYRRYWIFTSVPGLFVEHYDEYVGTCSTPTPYIKVDLEDINFVKENFEKVGNVDILMLHTP
jgi:bromodomain adjacent to zinc finger domain protein 1A